MIKTIRKLTSLLCATAAIACTVVVLLQCPIGLSVAQTESMAQLSTESAGVLADAQPEWRYTRFGWQDANEWAMVGQIEHPPARRFDNLHPVVLAMLILFSVLVTMFWASNEWELAEFEMMKREREPGPIAPVDPDE